MTISPLVSHVQRVGERWGILGLLVSSGISSFATVICVLLRFDSLSCDSNELIDVFIKQLHIPVLFVQESWIWDRCFFGLCPIAFKQRYLVLSDRFGC